MNVIGMIGQLLHMDMDTRVFNKEAEPFTNSDIEFIQPNGECADPKIEADKTFSNEDALNVLFPGLEFKVQKNKDDQDIITVQINGQKDCDKIAKWLKADFGTRQLEMENHLESESVSEERDL